MDELIGVDCQLDWILKRKKGLKHLRKLAARRSTEFSRLMQIYRFERPPKPSAWFSRKFLNANKAMRPSVDDVAILFGEGVVRSKFGLDPIGLKRVWQKVEVAFSRDFAEVYRSDLKLDQIFLMTLQHLREYRKLLDLAERWGIGVGLCSELLWIASCSLRSELCKQYQFPRPFEKLHRRRSVTLGFEWVGAVDCRWLRRNRPHPGQKLAYRYDKACHGLSASLLVGADGRLLNVQIFLGHNNDQGALNRTQLETGDGSDFSQVCETTTMLSWLESLPKDVKILGDGGYFGTAHPGIASPNMNPYPFDDVRSKVWLEKLTSYRVIVENYFARTSFWYSTLTRCRTSIFRQAINASVVFMLVDEDLEEHPLRRDCSESTSPWGNA